MKQKIKNLVDHQVLKRTKTIDNELFKQGCCHFETSSCWLMVWNQFHFMNERSVLTVKQIGRQIGRQALKETNNVINI